VLEIGVLQEKFSELKCSKPEEDILYFEEQLNQSMTEEENLQELLTHVDLNQSVKPAPELKQNPTPSTSTDNEQLNPQINLSLPMPNSNLSNTNNSLPNSSINNLATANPTIINLSKPTPQNSLSQNVAYHSPQSSLFNRLANPIEKLLNNLTPSDGLTISSLLYFLKGLVTLRTQTSLTQKELFEIVPSYCFGPLQRKIIECKNLNQTWDETHKIIVATFIPVTMLEILKQDLVLRPQKYQEPLSLYIDEIKTNAQVLQCTYSELDLVTIIKNGIAPDIRNKLCFESNPLTFQDLENVAVNTNNKMYIDYLRDVKSCQPMYTLGNNYMNNTHQQNMVNPNPQAQYRNTRTQNTLHSKPITCYVCNKIGHIAKHCRSKPRNSLN